METKHLMKIPIKPDMPIGVLSGLIETLDDELARLGSPLSLRASHDLRFIELVETQGVE